MAALPELQKQSEMAAAYAGLGDSQAKPNCGSKLSAVSARPGAHRPAVACVREFRELCSTSQDPPFIWKSSLGGPIN